jgi:carbonic anhydrase
MNLPQKLYGASPTWRGKRVRLYSPSEHTIGGTRYDMEVTIESDRVIQVGKMTSVFSSFLFSINSPTAMFCTVECKKAINNFFDDLKLGQNNPSANGIRFADAFMQMDTDNRFNYIGSATVPPCNKNNMRDVIMTIYPIDAKHVQQFRSK